jgi:DNA-binding GntR family transcriptional regulator
MSSPAERGSRESRNGTQSKSAAERAYSFVRDRIIAGTYPGGTLLSEGEVSEAVQTSRTPVREAFLRLEVEGLLRLYPKRGALVVPVSAAEIHDVLDARLLIERHAAETVIQMGRHHELAAELRAILDQQHATGTSLDGPRFTELDRRFHSTLVEAAGNRLLADFYAMLRDRQLRMGTTALLRDPDRYAAILAEHTSLTEVIDAGDIAGITDILTGHLAATRVALTAI